MTTPKQQYATAQTELNDLGNVVATGAQVAPDLVMRIVIAMRERLARHQPAQVDEHHYLHGSCAHDGQRWPCLEVRGDLAVLGIRPANEGD